MFEIQQHLVVRKQTANKGTAVHLSCPCFHFSFIHQNMSCNQTHWKAGDFCNCIYTYVLSTPIYTDRFLDLDLLRDGLDVLMIWGPLGVLPAVDNAQLALGARHSRQTAVSFGTTPLLKCTTSVFLYVAVPPACWKFLFHIFWFIPVRCGPRQWREFHRHCLYHFSL